MLPRLVIFVSIIFVSINGQCASSGRKDEAQCSYWVPNGFCDQTFYSEAQKQAFCGTACGLCPATNCGAIYRGAAVTVQNVSTVATAATAIPTGEPITRAFAYPGCSLHLYTDPTPPAAGVAGTEAARSPITGSGLNVDIAGTPAAAAIAMRCTCP